MPLYEYYCRTCSAKFELLRSMSSADESATCPQGHPRATRTLSMFAAVPRSGGGDIATMQSGPGCGCGGGGCGCGH